MLNEKLFSGGKIINNLNTSSIGFLSPDQIDKEENEPENK